MGIEGIEEAKVEGIGENIRRIDGKKLRLSCLHGFRTSPAIFQAQLGKWDTSIHELLDLEFLQAPFAAEGKSDVEGMFPPPYFEWFSFNKLMLQRFTPYNGLEEAVEYIANYMKENGPFDGLMGFSQGAILSAYLVSLQEKGLALQDIEALQLVVIISGAKFPASKLEVAYSDTIKCPSIHFIGEMDFLRKHGEELVKLFKNPLVIRHTHGHTIPRLDVNTTSKVADHLKRGCKNSKFQLGNETCLFFEGVEKAI